MPEDQPLLVRDPRAMARPGALPRLVLLALGGAALMRLALAVLA